MTKPTLPVIASLLVSAGLAVFAGRAEAKAPEIKPTDWLNAKGTVTWDSLKGRLILVEKWATW